MTRSLLTLVSALGFILSSVVGAAALTAAYSGGDVGIAPPQAEINTLERTDKITGDAQLSRYDASPPTCEERPQD